MSHHGLSYRDVLMKDLEDLDHPCMDMGCGNLTTKLCAQCNVFFCKECQFHSDPDICTYCTEENFNSYKLIKKIENLKTSPYK